MNANDQYEQGYDDGYADGYAGRNAAIPTGHQAYDDGYAAGYEDGIFATNS